VQIAHGAWSWMPSCAGSQKAMGSGGRASGGSVIWPHKKNPIHKLQKSFSWNKPKDSPPGGSPAEPGSPTLEPTGGQEGDVHESNVLLASAQEAQAKQTQASYMVDVPAAAKPGDSLLVRLPGQEESGVELKVPPGVSRGATLEFVLPAARPQQTDTMAANEDGSLANDVLRQETAAAQAEQMVANTAILEHLANIVIDEEAAAQSQMAVAQETASAVVSKAIDESLAATELAREIVASAIDVVESHIQQSGSQHETEASAVDIDEVARAFIDEVLQTAADAATQHASGGRATTKGGFFGVVRAANTEAKAGRLWGVISSITDKLSLSTYSEFETETSEENPFRWL